MPSDPDLIPVDMFAEHEKEIDQRQNLERVARRAGNQRAEALRHGSDPFTAVRVLKRVLPEPAEHLENRAAGDFHAVETGGRLGRQRAALRVAPAISPHPVEQPREAELTDGLPIRHGVVEVLPDRRSAGTFAELPQLRQLRRSRSASSLQP